jgi:hypothetical protein
VTPEVPCIFFHCFATFPFHVFLASFSAACWPVSKIKNLKNQDGPKVVGMKEFHTSILSHLFAVCL